MAKIRNRSTSTHLSIYTAVLALGLPLALMLTAYPVTAHAQNLDAATCTVAKGLVDRGFPTRALVLLEDALQPANPITGALCPDERTAATRKIDESFLKASDAKKLLDEEKWPEALSAAEAALAANLDNEAARTISQSAKDQIKNEPKTKLKQLQEGWKELSKDHLLPLSDLLVPFAAVLAVLLVLSRLLILWVTRWPSVDGSRTAGKRRILIAGLTNLLISSALFTFGLAGGVLIFPWPSAVSLLFPLVSAVLAWRVLVEAREASSELEPADDRTNRIFQGIASTFTVIASIFTVFAVALYLFRPTELRSATLAFAILAGIVGAALTAWWFAIRLRLEVKVTHKDDKEQRAEAALVAALLYELGAEKPRGLEVPRGVDTTALAGALTELPDNVIGKIIRYLVNTVTGTTPWVAHVEGDADRRTVSISRNGRPVDSAVIDRHTFDVTSPNSAVAEGGPDSFSDASLRMASAFILVTLAKYHPSIQDGLAGAMNWRSVGLQYIATNLFPGDINKIKRTEILARAVQLDPENIPAQLALRHTTDRKSDSARVLIEYRDWLQDRETALISAGFAGSAVLLRACYTRTTIATNAAFAAGGTDIEQTSSRVVEAQNAFSTLDNLLMELGQNSDLKPLITRIEDSSIGLRMLLTPEGGPAGTGWSGGVGSVAESPTGIYDSACYFASKHSWDLLLRDEAGELTPDLTINDDREAVTLLRRAAADPDISSWMQEDPQLRDFRLRGPFRTNFLIDPRSDFFAWEPIRPYAKALRSAGYVDVEALVAANSEDNPLAVVVPADAAARRAITFTAYLLSTVPLDLKNRNWHLELLDEVRTRGLATEQALSGLSMEQRVVISYQIAKHLVSKFKIGTQGNTYGDEVALINPFIRAWLTSFTR